MTKRLSGLMKWWGVLILGHTVAFLLFAMLFSNMTTELQMDGLLDRAYWITLIFDLVYWGIYLFLSERIASSAVENRRRIRAELTECGSVLSCIKRYHASDLLLRLGVFLFNQLPATFFFVSYPLSFEGISIIERLWIADAGFYAVTGSAFLGLLLITICVGFFMLVMRLIFLKQIQTD